MLESSFKLKFRCLCRFRFAYYILILYHFWNQPLCFNSYIHLYMYAYIHIHRKINIYKKCMKRHTHYSEVALIITVELFALHNVSARAESSFIQYEFLNMDYNFYTLFVSVTTTLRSPFTFNKCIITVLYAPRITLHFWKLFVDYYGCLFQPALIKIVMKKAYPS